VLEDGSVEITFGEEIEEKLPKVIIRFGLI
jgi:hypothetical protein